MITKKTAILIFDSFQNEKGTGNSFLAPNTLYCTLTNSIVKKVRRTGLDYFHFTEKKQRGNSFGKRFCNAITAIYNKGYDAVITIGNDIPDLEIDHILRAKQLLDNNKFVLGPSFDGGFYLMGLQKDYFDNNKFESFSWNSAKIALEIKSYIKKFTQDVVTFNYLYDIDTFLDLKKVYKTLSIAQKKLLLIIQELIQVKTVNYTYVVFSLFQLHHNNFHNKGSPLI